MTDPAAPSIAANLETLLNKGKAKVSVDEVVALVERGHGLAPIVCILTLPALLPMPPGVSMALALPLLIAAPQMMLGRENLWLPKALARRAIDRDKLQKGVARVVPWLHRLEAVVRPRLTFLTGRAGAVVAGAVCTLMAVVLVLPLPFANLLPALTVLLITLGLSRRDGLVVIAGLLLLAAAAAALVWGLRSVRLGWTDLFGLGG
jgi:hypothetical protein